MGRQLSFLNIQFRGILRQDADIRQLRAIALHIAFALAPDAALVCRIDRHVIDRALLRFLAQKRAHIRIGQALAVPEGQLRSPGVQDCAMRRRIRKLQWKLKRMGGVDIVVTHAPPYGLGDGDDPAHWGFESLVELLDTYHPQYLVHGHVHMRYGARDRVRDYNGTTLINATERYAFEIPDRPVDGKELGQVIYKTRQGRDDPWNGIAEIRKL